MSVDTTALEAINERLRREKQELAAENVELRKRLADTERQWSEKVAALEAQLKQALDRIAELERKSARQAAPFRRDRQKKGHGKPGRKAGFRGTQRQRPPQIDQEIEVPLEVNRCPDCDCRLDRQPLTQIIEEIPPQRPVVTRLTTWHATCPCCQRTWHSEHELQVSTAQGAAGVHLGPRATALATLLKSHFGLTLRKAVGVLKQGFGLSISAGGLSHLLQRVARKAQTGYDELLEQIRTSPVVHADETSWYVGQPDYWLWVFTTPQYTLYHVDESRGRPVAESILGKKFAGVLVTDCASTYKNIACKQHKCIAHHLRRLYDFRKLPDMQDATYLDAWEQFWRDVLDLTKARDDLPREEFAGRHAAIKLRLEALLAQRVSQVGDRKFQTRMRNAQPHLLGCLEHHVEPTNNRAERAIRPAVIARKVSCGNKTPRGAHTWEILASHCTTLAQQGKDLLADFVALVAMQPATPKPVPAG